MSGWSLKRRLADAACAFQTGHSVRGYRRSYSRRVALLALRVANHERREAETRPEHAEGLLASAQSIENAVNRHLETFEGKSLSFLLDRAFIERSRSRRGEAEALGVEIIEHGIEACRCHFEPDPVSSLKFQGHLYKGLFEDGSFDFLFYQHFVGRWDWHRFLRWLKASLAFQGKRLTRKVRPQFGGCK
ncbi:hypothetical protein [Labrenzia sp. DG1229]|uniref:hypothetical protein n=1 Tax=Labrenzia sp. DG1229 TaxID=681847 RepID=UPI00055A7D37|nr:hypothetical protein [Labrenzia sp. DG1229]